MRKSARKHNLVWIVVGGIGLAVAGWVATALLVGMFVGIGRTVGEHFTGVVATPTRGVAAAFLPSVTPTVAFPDLMVSTATDVATARVVVTAKPVPATPTPVPTATPATVTLPVHLLVTRCALAGCSFAYPSSVTVDVPPPYAGALGAYGAAGIVVVGPAGWTGEGRVGGNGNTFVSLYPVGSSRTRGSRVEVTTESTGAAMLNAASYFEQARLDEQHEGNPAPPPPAGITEVFINPELVAYRLPNTPDGQGIDGVAYFTDKVPGTIFKQEEVVLPLDERGLSTVMLDAFIARSNLNPAVMGPSPSASVAAQESRLELLGVPVPDEGRIHVPEGSAIAFKGNPPSSGPHYPSTRPWGIYIDPTTPGYFVHNLEHGGIVVLYDCPSGCATVVDTLHQAYTTFPKDKYGEVKLLISPYAGLPNHAQVTALSWDYRMVYTAATPFTLENLRAFYDAHLDRGPEDLP